MIFHLKSRLLASFAWLRIALLAIAGLLSSCQSPGSINPSGGLPQQPGITQGSLLPEANGEIIGNGTQRVALLIPSTAPGNAAKVALELRNGATMALQDFGLSSLQLVIKDTKGQAAEAQARANEAIREGSSLVLGPLFAANVSAAAGITLPSNIVMLAFSTDTSVARRGVYLLSYTPEDDTRRILNYAASIDRKSITAFLANNAEGALRENMVRQIAGANGIRINIVKYSRTKESIKEAVTKAVPLIQASDTIYIPEGGAIPNAVLNGLRRNGVAVHQKQILGSGAWEAIKQSEAVLNGAAYPGRDISKFEGFEQRYEESFGEKPGVQAALGYDAVTMAAELLRINGPEKTFKPKSLENNRGFQGINGIFRLRPSGTTQRGLAIYQIREGKGQIAIPAPTGFSGNANF